MFRKPAWYIFFISLIVSVCFAFSSEVGISVQVDDTDVKTGDIVSYSKGVYKKSVLPYDLTMFGVVADNPVISVEDTNLTSYKLVVSQGEAAVNVSGANGDISKGDYITSSNNPGIGVKAKTDGQVLGVSLEDYTFADKNSVGQILVYVDIRPNFFSNTLRGSLFSFMKSTLESPFIAPLTSLRYFLAAGILIVAFILGFSSFGRISHRSVEAIGRNPLAGKSITSLVVFNFILTFLIIGVGMGLAYLILSL